MRYWDTSAILPLIVNESNSPAMLALFGADAAIVTWWATRVECVSALARLERDKALDTRAMRAAMERLDALSRQWAEVPALESVRTHAARLLRTHPLRAADAVQLAAATVACNFEPAALPLVSLDTRLSEAAAREGFSVLEA